VPNICNGRSVQLENSYSCRPSRATGRSCANYKEYLILLTAVQVIKVVLLALILLAMLALLITVNPDLEDERAAAVTPAMKWIIHRVSSFFPPMYSQKDLERRKADRIQEKSR
jgi:hypothetical protein